MLSSPIQLFTRHRDHIMIVVWCNPWSALVVETGCQLIVGTCKNLVEITLISQGDLQEIQFFN